MRRYSVSDVVFIILTVLLAVGVTFFEAFILMKYWEWFVVPATGFGEISYWLAFGIGLLLSFIRIGATANQTKSVNTGAELFEYALGFAIGYAIFLGLGAWVHCGL